MTKGKIMKRIVLAVATVLLAAGVATGASAAAAAPLPNGVHVKGLTYQPGVHLAAPHLPRFTPASIGILKSTNWSGYVDVACKTCAVRYVGASFNLPSVNCSALPDGSTVSFWAGLDGFSDTATEQIGAAAQCKSGAASYFLWYEMFPLIPAKVVPTGVRHFVAVLVEVNPISPELLAQARRWLSRPGSERLSGGETFLGSFVSIFVNTKVSEAERIIKFRSQPFYRQAPK